MDCPWGAITGGHALDSPGWLLVPRPNHGKVPVARTQVDGMARHVTPHVARVMMGRNPKVRRYAVHVRRTGRFPAGGAASGAHGRDVL